MNSFWAMVVANCKMTVRNRQAIFWNLAFPAIFILIFGAVFGNGNETTFDIGVSGVDGPLREQVVAGLESSEGFVVHVGDEAGEREELENGERAVVLTVPASLENGEQIGLLYTDDGGPTSSVARLAVENALLGLLEGESNSPIAQQPVRTLGLSFMDVFVPGVLAMSIMNSGVIGLSTAFTSYREKGILRRIKVTPFALWKFILARVVAQMLVIVADCLILVIVAKLAWGLTIRGNWLLALAMIVLGALAFLAIGYAISSFARNTESAASYANLVTFPMLFLSGVFFPVDTMPDWLHPILRLLPLRYLVDGMRETMTYGDGLNEIWIDAVVLAGMFAVAMAFAVRFFKWDATVR